MRLFLLILALIAVALANRGRQITIWNPLETTAPNATISSFRPTDIVPDTADDYFLRRDHLFTPALSQDALYQNPPHCIFGHEMYCNGKFYNYTLDGGQKYWGYDNFQTEVYADGYGYGFGYDYYDGSWFDLPKNWSDVHPHHHQAPIYESDLNIPTYFQNGQNRDQYVKLAHFWQNLDNQTPLPADQCYTVYLDVNSPDGKVAIGLAMKQMLNGHNHGWGHPMAAVEYNDTFIGFFRDTTTPTLTAGFLSGVFTNGTIPNNFNITTLLTCGAASCTTPKNFILTIEVCNQTTISFQETYPLGVQPPATNYNPETAVFDIDLRGNGSIPSSLDVYIAGHNGTDVFVVTAKVVPLNKTESAGRLVFATVMDGSELNPANFDATLTEVSANAVFANNQLTITDNFQYSEYTETEAQKNPIELFCFRVQGLTNNQDYSIDVGVFAESLPAELNGDKSLVVGLRQDNMFVGFNRLGFYSDSLGNVIYANVNGNGLVNITRMDHVIQNRPSNGLIQSSNITAPHFNVRFNIYGASDSGVSVFAGTPDSPPYTFVWAAVEATFDFTSQVDLCFYHQAESTVDIWSADPSNQWKNVTTVINGLTYTVEKAQFGCDGQDLSGAQVDNCGVCGGKNECAGCDGVPYSGKILDACGKCNGTNDTCCTNRFGISDSVWDWLLLPHIVDDVSQRLKSLSSQLTTTCTLLEGYSNYCNHDLSIIGAFNDISLDKLQTDIQDFEQQCLADFRTSITDMVRDVSVWVPLNHYGQNL